MSCGVLLRKNGGHIARSCDQIFIDFSFQIKAVVVVVNWRPAKLPKYAEAVEIAKFAAIQAAFILDLVIETSDGNMDPNRTHWIGHGLGAQVATFFSATFDMLRPGGIIGQITGLFSLLDYCWRQNFDE